MKQQLVHMILALALLAACEKPGEADGGEFPPAALELRVSAGDFTTDGTPAARATDNGNATVFAENDRVGVIVVGRDGTLLHDNVPYKYDGKTWVFDSETTDGKTACHYYAPGATYIVYYPYDKAADGVTDPAGLEERFPPRTDQREEEAYRASDLMACSTTDDASGGTLTVTLQHVYTSVSFTCLGKVILDDGNNTPYVSALSKNSISDICFSTGNRVYQTFRAADGSYRCILPAGDAGEITCFYTSHTGSDKDGTYSLTITTPARVAGTRYVSTIQYDDLGTYTLARTKTGDFCCKSTGGKIYFIPAEATLDDTRKEECLGIVFYMRESGSPNDAGGYDEFSDSPAGYIIAPNENTGQWATRDIGQDRNTSKDIINGYFETYKFERHMQDDCIAMAWCRAKTRIPDDVSGSVAFSKWYMMSYRELYLLTRQLEVIQASLTEAGDPLQNSFYFTAGRMGGSGNFTYILNPITMSEKGENSIVRATYPYRAACAFKINN